MIEMGIYLGQKGKKPIRQKMYSLSKTVRITVTECTSVT